MTQSCLVCKELNQKAPANPNIDQEQPKTDLQPFKLVGLDMFSWKGIQYLLIIDRMSGYIRVQNLNHSALCKTVTQKFKLLCLTYQFPCHVRFSRVPQFGSDFEVFLKDINERLSPSSANNPASNGLAKSTVKSTKVLLRKSIEEKSNYPKILCHFNQAPWKDSYSQNELFHGKRVRS